MIRLLDGLVLLKEIDEIGGCEHSSSQLRKMYPEHIVIIRHTSYIYKNALCKEIDNRVTLLDDYIQLGEFADYVAINKSLIKERIKFMNETGIELFKYVVIGGVGFIRLDSEFKYLLQNYQPFLATLQDYNLTHCKLLGDLKIGFY